MKRKENRGFTLIELLVVIAIIGILSSVVLASLNTARQKSRDAKRISDVKQLQLALEFYFDANNGYPSAINIANIVDPGYIAVIPTPPTGASEYDYTAIGAGCLDYHIGTTLEDTGHAVLSSDVNATAESGTNQCPDEGSSSAKTDFDGTAAGVYDLKP